jgi:tetratricopeptide (TPR) repeat protein
VDRLVDARLLATRREALGGAPAVPEIDLVEVAHEALFRVWPMLAAWLEAEREFLIGKSRIERAREDFQALPESERGKGFLLGILLERAKHWLIAHPGRFSPEEAAFITISVAHADRLAAERAAERERLRQAELARAKADAERAQEAERRAEAEAASARERATIARRWQHRAVGAAVVFAAIGGLAAFESYRAGQETERAEGNFAAAKNAVDGIIFNVAQKLDVTSMPTAAVRNILGAVRATVEDLAKKAPYDEGLRRSQIAMYSAFVDTYLAARDLEAAEAAGKDGLALAQETTGADTETQRFLAVSLYKLGDVRLAKGDVPSAANLYQQSAMRARALIAASPNDPQIRRTGWVAQEKVADATLQAGHTDEALKLYRQGVADARLAAEQRRDDTEAQRDLSYGLDHLGDALREAGDSANAVQAYAESLSIRRKLFAGDPRDARAQRDVAIALAHLGDARAVAGNFTEATAAYEESLQIDRLLAARNRAARDLAVSLVHVGDASLEEGDKPRSIAIYSESLAVARQLAALDPESVAAQTDLVSILTKLASVSDEPGALDKEALDILAVLDRGGKLTPELRGEMELLRVRLAEPSAGK